jgi:hypothetical protein
MIKVQLQMALPLKLDHNQSTKEAEEGWKGTDAKVFPGLVRISNDDDQNSSSDHKNSSMDLDDQRCRRQK